MRECEAANATCDVVMAHVTVVTALPAPWADVDLWPCNRLQ